VAVVAHVLSLVAGFVVLLAVNRDQWFFGDEWEFLGHHRGVLHADRSIWMPHTEHWSTVPILVYRALYSVYGLRSYVPYVVVLLVLHVAVAHLLWQLMRKAGVDLPVATALCAVFVVLGAGYENLLWAFQIGFIGSVAAGLACLLLVNHDGPWGGRDYAGWAVSVFGLLFSGVTVTLVIVAGLTVFMRRGWRPAVLTVAVPAAVYAVWFFLVGNDSLASDRGALDDVFKLPDYIWTGLRAAVEQTVGFPGAGPLIVLGLAAFLLRRGTQAPGPSAPAFAGAIGAVVVYAIIATGRAGLGVQQAEASRYTYIAVALAVPSIGLALSELTGNGLGRRAVVFVLLLLVGLHNGGLLRDKSKEESRREREAKDRILYAADLVATQADILGGNPEPRYSPDLEVDDLRLMVRDGKLPKARRASVDDRIAVATVLQYAVNPTPLPIQTFPPRVDGVVGGTDERDDVTGCVRVFPDGPVTEIHLEGHYTMSVRVTAEVSGDLTGYLRMFTPRVLTGDAHVDKVKGGVPVFVNMTSSVDQVVLRLPRGGMTEVCGVL
jgi:hypothetical protein